MASLESVTGRPIRVYIASPYRKGDAALNVRYAMAAADKLMDMGFMPYQPLMSHFQQLVFPRADEEWLSYDLLWVEICDCVLRLPGESSGADGEVEHARTRDIPVFYSLDELISYCKCVGIRLRV